LIFEVLLTAKDTKKKTAKDTKKPMTENKMTPKIFLNCLYNQMNLLSKNGFNQYKK